MTENYLHYNVLENYWSLKKIQRLSEMLEEIVKLYRAFQKILKPSGK